MNTRLTRSFVRLIAVSVGLCASVAAYAVPITYLFTGTASGSYTPVGGTVTSFVRQDLSVTINTDTTNIDTTRFGAGTPATNALVSGATITISGIGTGTFTLPLYVFDNQATETVGFGDLSHLDLINVRNLAAGLDTYGLVTAFGPITGTPPNFVSQFSNVDVGIGSLSISTLNDATFQAITGRNAVPEPASLALLGLGLIGLGFSRRKNTC